MLLFIYNYLSFILDNLDTLWNLLDPVCLQVLNLNGSDKCWKSQPNNSKLLYHCIANALKANAFTFSSAIKACERQSCWEAVSKLLLHMANGNVQGNSYTFNAAIGTFGKVQMWPMALSLTKEMTIQQIQSDIITGSTLVGSLEPWPNSGRPIKFWRLPKFRAWCAIQATSSDTKITSAEENAQWPKALQAFDLLAASQVPRNAPWTNAAIVGWGWWHHQNQGMWAARRDAISNTNGGFGHQWRWTSSSPSGKEKVKVKGDLNIHPCQYQEGAVKNCELPRCFYSYLI